MFSLKRLKCVIVLTLKVFSLPSRLYWSVLFWRFVLAFLSSEKADQFRCVERALLLLPLFFHLIEPSKFFAGGWTPTSQITCLPGALSLIIRDIHFIHRFPVRKIIISSVVLSCCDIRILRFLYGILKIRCTFIHVFLVLFCNRKERDLIFHY